jgi:hypothetical protein
MPFTFSTLTLAEFEIMRNAKLELLRLTNPHLVPLNEDKKEQSQEEQSMMIQTANMMFGGS